MITIVDYGIGNLGSVSNMYKKLGIKNEITASKSKIYDAEKILLPGVGSFDNAMKKINNSGLRDVLDKKVKVDKTPILGICLGMQILTKNSEEGKEKGLGYINARTKKFEFTDKKYKIPHMGWNFVKINKKNQLINDLPDDSKFYFVHSYYVEVKHQDNSILKTDYQIQFDSAINFENVYGVQFHPEKSHKFGMKLLDNFAKI